MVGDRVALPGRQAVAKILEMAGGQFHEVLVIDPAHRGQHHLLRTVSDLPVSQQFLTAHLGDMVGFPQDGSAQGGVAPEMAAKGNLHLVFGIIVLGADLLQDDLALALRSWGWQRG